MQVRMYVCYIVNFQFQQRKSGGAREYFRNVGYRNRRRKVKLSGVMRVMWRAMRGERGAAATTRAAGTLDMTVRTNTRTAR